MLFSLDHTLCPAIWGCRQPSLHAILLPEDDGNMTAENIMSMRVILPPSSREEGQTADRPCSKQRHGAWFGDGGRTRVDRTGGDVQPASQHDGAAGAYGQTAAPRQGIGTCHFKGSGAHRRTTRVPIAAREDQRPVAILPQAPVARHLSITYSGPASDRVAGNHARRTSRNAFSRQSSSGCRNIFCPFPGSPGPAAHCPHAASKRVLLEPVRSGRGPNSLPA
jgi:hypothetical protein